MRRTHLFLFTIAVIALLLAPQAAFAATRHYTYFRGINTSYAPSPSGAMVLKGHLYSRLSDNLWTRHDSRVWLQGYQTSSHQWVTLARAATTRWGWFSFSLAGASSGQYRVLFPGCAHFRPRSRCFEFKRQSELTLDAFPVEFPVTLQQKADGAGSIPIQMTSNTPLTSLTNRTVTLNVEGSVSSSGPWTDMAGIFPWDAILEADGRGNACLPIRWVPLYSVWTSSGWAGYVRYTAEYAGDANYAPCEVVGMTYTTTPVPAPPDYEEVGGGDAPPEGDPGADAEPAPAEPPPAD